MGYGCLVFDEARHEGICTQGRGSTTQVVYSTCKGEQRGKQKYEHGYGSADDRLRGVVNDKLASESEKIYRMAVKGMVLIAKSER